VYRGRLGMDEWCADLAEVARAEGYSRAVLVGHCLGANIAIEFASRHPEKTLGLVLVEPMVRPALTGTLRTIAKLRPLFVPAIQAILALNALGLHRRRLAALDLARLDRETRAAMARAGTTAALARRYASPWHDLRETPSVAYLQMLIAVTTDLPDLAAIRAPALGLLSSGTAFTDPAITERLLARLPSRRIVWLDADHWIPTERPEEMRRAIEDWCAVLGSPVGA
jgi:pimeloyl-ACP methyl ester carboxylesterase